jgi:LuxR family maltose regulon positive regulatory protein
VLRPRLIERIDEGLPHKLILISAPAGFGKTTLVSEWLAAGGWTAAWLSLDEGDNDPARFLTYLVAALQTVAAQQPQSATGNLGEGLLAVLQSPQPPSTESILTTLLNEVAAIPVNFVLVLDDYHVIDAKPIDDALAFLLERLPPRMRLVIATREDPQLPLARLRAGGQLTELRAIDLRFTHAEAAEFLNRGMGLNLSAQNIAALEARTEGWIAGLQLAALSLQGQQDATSFIKSFTGSHRFVMDYLAEEVLQQQPETIQTFLLRTSILNRLCGSLCDAVVGDASHSGQETLEYLEHANLFIVPLDNERRWYRYHHLFAELLRQRLDRSLAPAVGNEGPGVVELHIRASEWYEDNGLEIEAFHHAAAAGDVERAARLVEGKGMPLIFRGAAAPVLTWLESLSAAALDARPSLWVLYGSALLFASQVAGVEEKLQAAEAALQGVERDAETRDLIGHIAVIRATLSAVRQDVETTIAQSRRALEYLHADNLPVRTATTWTLGVAYQVQGDRAAAERAFTEAGATAGAIGHYIIALLATSGLGNIQEADNRLHQAAETYGRVLQMAGDPPLPAAYEAYLGLARIDYEWNDLDTAGERAAQSAQLARQIANTDRSILCETFLAHVKRARGDVAGATAALAAAEQSALRHPVARRTADVAAAQAQASFERGDLEAAERLAQTHKLPIIRARVHLARGETAAALAALEAGRREAEQRDWADERLRAMVLQAVALRAHGEEGRAIGALVDALALAEPGGFVRIFIDEGRPMAELLTRMKDEGGRMREYVHRLLAAFEKQTDVHPSSLIPQPLIEPLSRRELEVLQLIARGLSNHEIGEQLFLALSTVKGHNRNIFDKLQVQRRTEAIARARELGLL